MYACVQGTTRRCSCGRRTVRRMPRKPSPTPPSSPFWILTAVSRTGRPCESSYSSKGSIPGRDRGACLGGFSLVPRAGSSIGGVCMCRCRCKPGSHLLWTGRGFCCVWCLLCVMFVMRDVCCAWCLLYVVFVVRCAVRMSMTAESGSCCWGYTLRTPPRRNVLPSTCPTARCKICNYHWCWLFWRLLRRIAAAR